MDLPPDDSDALIGLLKEGPVGFGFAVNRGGDLLGIGDFADELVRIAACRALIVATAVYGRWVLEKESLDQVPAASAGALSRALQARPSDEAFRALLQLIGRLRLFDPHAEGYPDELRFRFAGAYLENPLHLRFLAVGTVACLGLCVTTLAAAQLMKEWDSPACQARGDGMARTQFDMLQSLAHREGKWTNQHAQSHKAITDAARVARSACGSLLSNIQFRLHLPAGVDYEVKLGSAPPAPSL
ncbi:hypothetical protein [Methylobacterium sp. R2-1]|uniref:hypothetical protein n=1 Tax=Methylobacterium sp. R2-1 TaxID=2587064 RepID=UPI0016145C0D|nr:hypothetical protein [Methylobacterium sp. R2-1]MBB2963399.1 hypothetical protein [Methylobacterium sp. R2-1]